MRVKGGPRAQGAQQANKAQSGGKAAAAKFAGLLNDPEENEEKARNLRSQMLEELRGLAQELEEGTSSKEEASRRFVGLVIRERYGSEKGKGGKTMEDSIADLVEEDPNFVSKLQTQLKKIAKEK